MPATDCAHRVAAALLALCASGCASFLVVDVYDTRFETTELRAAPPDGGPRFDVDAESDVRFLALGLLGLPIVPVWLDVTPQDEIEIGAQLELRGDPDFSLALRPCVETAGGDRLCAAQTRVWWRREWARTFPSTGGDERVARLTRAELAQGTGSSAAAGATETLRASYVFRCGGACPARFALDTKPLAEVEGRGALTGTMTFRSERQTEYDPWISLEGHNPTIRVSTRDLSADGQ